MDPSEQHHKQQLVSSRNSGSVRDSSSALPDDGGTPHGAPEAPDSTSRQPRYSDGFTMIPPNQSRRSKMQMMAQKEEEDLKRWKETNRPQYVQQAPERLGGDVTMAQARQKQLINAQCSRLQKKLKKEDLDKRRRQEEEEELQKMKAEKRSVAERQQEKRQQEEQRRREQLREDHLRTNDSFLQRFDRTAPAPWPSGSATHTSSGGEQSISRQSQRSCAVKADIQEEVPSSQDLVHERSSAPGQQSALCLDPEPEESRWEDEAVKGSVCIRTVGSSAWYIVVMSVPAFLLILVFHPERDYDWALMKLMHNFPDFARVFLEDILNQCNGDYNQAYTLLSCTLS